MSDELKLTIDREVIRELKEINRLRYAYIPPIKKPKKVKSFEKVCPMCTDAFLGFSNQKFCGRRCAGRSGGRGHKKDTSQP